MKHFLMLLLMIISAVHFMSAQISSSTEYFMRLKNGTVVVGTIYDRAGEKLFINSAGKNYFLKASDLPADQYSKVMTFPENKFKLDPALYLKGAGVIGKTSIVMGILGSVAMAISTRFSKQPQKIQDIIFYSGAGLSAGGIILQIGAWNRVQKAGILQSTNFYQ